MERQQSIIESRRDQMFPTLSAAEMARLERFGDLCRYPAGSLVARAGEVAPGLQVILRGEVRVAPHEDHLRDRTIITHGPGSFIGELAQLSGRPSLIDAMAISEVDAIVIPPKRIRDMIVEDADLGELVMRALILRRVGLLELGVGGPIIVGLGDRRDVLRLQGFLSRNGHPHHHLDPRTDTCAQTLLERFHVDSAELPIVLCGNGQLLRNPSERQLARCIGLDRPADAGAVYDVAIVGAGPSGLAAAVYAASEGLSVITVDCRAFGGQAGASARIENYLGFPTGISGMALMARAYNQAQKFGAETAIPEEVHALDVACEAAGKGFVLSLQDDERLRAQTVVIATGAQYRRLDVEGIGEYEGVSVHYWASPLERRLCRGAEVALVGAGNSAGQAAVYLSGNVAKVLMIVRGPSVEATMSRYLCDRIAALPNVEVLLHSYVSGVEGEVGRLQAVQVTDRRSSTQRLYQVRHLFLFIGAQPNTAWLAQSGIEVDDKGFVLAHPEATSGRLPFETSWSGVFAIGDVRAGSTKRVAAAVGEGAQVAAALHQHLALSRTK